MKPFVCGNFRKQKYYISGRQFYHIKLEPVNRDKPLRCIFALVLDNTSPHCIIGNMKTKQTKHYNPIDGKLYTEKQLLKFRFFCYKHDLYFHTLPEYNSALAQFFSE